MTKPRGIRTRCPFCEMENRLDPLGRPRRNAGASLSWGCEGCGGRGYVYATQKHWVAPERRKKQ